MNLFLMIKKKKFLIPINVCVHPKYRGMSLFSKMIIKFEQIAKSLNFDGIFAISNKAATPGWQRSINLKNLKALDVYFGFGKFNPKK